MALDVISYFFMKKKGGNHLENHTFPLLLLVINGCSILLIKAL